MLKKKSSPTFASRVTVYVHGGEKHEINIVWRHKRRDEFQAYFSAALENSTPMIDQLLDLAESWSGIEFELNRAGLEELQQEYPPVISQLLMAYAEEIAEGRRKN